MRYNETSWNGLKSNEIWWQLKNSSSTKVSGKFKLKYESRKCQSFLVWLVVEVVLGQISASAYHPTLELTQCCLEFQLLDHGVCPYRTSYHIATAIDPRPAWGHHQPWRPDWNWKVEIRKVGQRKNQKHVGSVEIENSWHIISNKKLCTRRCPSFWCASRTGRSAPSTFGIWHPHFS